MRKCKVSENKKITIKIKILSGRLMAKLLIFKKTKGQEFGKDNVHDLRHWTSKSKSTSHVKANQNRRKEGRNEGNDGMAY